MKTNLLAVCMDVCNWGPPPSACFRCALEYQFLHVAPSAAYSFYISLYHPSFDYRDRAGDQASRCDAEPDHLLLETKPNRLSPSCFPGFANFAATLPAHLETCWLSALEYKLLCWFPVPGLPACLHNPYAPKKNFPTCSTLL